MSAIEHITSQAQLFQILDEHHYSTWDMYDTDDIMCGIGNTYNAVDPSYMLSARTFDSKIPDEFFATVIDADSHAAKVVAQLTFPDGEDVVLTDTRKRLAGTDAKRKFVINEENYWVFRECYRSWKGIYKKLPCMNYLWKTRKFKREYMYHFPHVSLDDPTMMAYTPSHEYGKRDRQVRVRVGKYLQKYYGDVLTSEEIRSFANGAKGFELKFGETKEDFRRVYRYGPHSCMASRRDHWDGASGDFHPMDVYEGEFKIAYLEPAVNIIVARAFVHEPTKSWVRAYGDEADTLINLIEERGYEKVSSWGGAKLRYITDDDGKRLMPYLDGDYKNVVYVGGSDYHWLVTGNNNGGYFCDSTCGFIEEDIQETHYCPRCSHECDEDDLRYSEYEDATFCDNCSDDFVWAVVDRRGNCDYVHTDNYIECRSTGTCYTPEAAEENGLVEDRNGDWWNADDLVETIDSAMMHPDDTVEVGEGSYGETLYYPRDEAPTDCIFVIEGNDIDQVVYDEAIPDDMQEEIDDQRYITNDFGLSVPEKYFTFRELLLTYGVVETQIKLRRIGFVIGAYTLNNLLEKFQQLPVAA